MRKTSEKVIGNEKYMVGHWHVDKQLAMMTRLIKLLGEPLAMIIMGGGSTSAKSMMEMKVEPATIAKSVASLASRLGEEEVKQFFRDAVEGVRCNGKEIEFNTHFMGRVFTLMKVALFCIRHQYQDFLEEVPVLREGLGTDLDQAVSM